MLCAGRWVVMTSYSGISRHLHKGAAGVKLLSVIRALEKFFTLGQTLPTHRLAHSIHGGPFQPTMTQSIRLLSQQPFKHHPNKWPGEDPQMSLTDISDPFSSNQLTYTTNGHDTFPAPSAFLSRRHSWVHVFPEGKTHQKQDYTMRYFKWGVARLILESEPCPDLVPIWIEGLDRVMHESRKWPRFIPRVGKDINVTFGKQVDVDAAFGDLRRRWRMLLVRERGPDPREVSELGVIPDPLKYGSDAVKLREECALRVRDELLKVRRGRGWADEDPKARLVDTWREEGKQGKQGKQEGKMADGSWVKGT